MQKWLQQEKNAFIAIPDLLKYLNVSRDQVRLLEEVCHQYPLKITPYYRGLLEPDNETDPLRKICVPSAEELEERTDESSDPLDEADASIFDGPIQLMTARYSSRVLIFPTTMCGGYCRFCFRKRMTGQHHTLTKQQFNLALNYIRHHMSIHEVILSGGDPLMLPDDQLSFIIREIRRIPHIRTIRLHTRMPVWNPYRLTSELVSTLQKYHPLWLVLHINHPRELTEQLQTGVSRLLNKGIPVLNQSVLLRGINDSVALQEELGWALIKSRVQPYYLHHLDRARGTSHFRVTIAEGTRIMCALKERLPGYAFPRYVLDLPGSSGKISLLTDRALPFSASGAET